MERTWLPRWFGLWRRRLVERSWSLRRVGIGRGGLVERSWRLRRLGGGGGGVVGSPWCRGRPRIRWGRLVEWHRCLWRFSVGRRGLLARDRRRRWYRVGWI